MNRLDIEIVNRGILATRSQALNYIKLKKIKVNGLVCEKPAKLINETDKIELFSENEYVSRAGFKLDSVAKILKLDFRGKKVLDVGSSTGGFSDYALQNGAELVYAVDVGTNQLHPKIANNSKVQVHEKTDIRDFKLNESEKPDIILIDVSFISLTMILPHLYKYLMKKDNSTVIVAMMKPQFEAKRHQLNKGIVKNSAYRREIIHNFEYWLKNYFIVIDKKDSSVKGEKGNLERFYLLKAKR